MRAFRRRKPILSFPIEGANKLERREKTLGVFAYGPHLTVNSPANSRVKHIGVASAIGKYIILENKTLQHLYRFFLLSDLPALNQGEWVRPGQEIAKATHRVYYDILRPGSNSLYLPDTDEQHLFVNPKALHDDLWKGGIA